MTKMKMFAVALALTFLGLVGSETAGVSNLFGNDRLNFGIGNTSTSKQHNGYPQPGSNVLVRNTGEFLRPGRHVGGTATSAAKHRGRGCGNHLLFAGPPMSAQGQERT